MRTQDVAVDFSQVKELTFMGEVHGFSWMEDGDINRGLLIPIVENKFEKVCNLLAGNDAYSLKKGDKIYKIPACAFDDHLVKRVAKKFGAMVTDDVDKATVFLGNENLGRWMGSMEVPGRDDLFFHHEYFNPGKSVSYPHNRCQSYSVLEDVSNLPEVFSERVVRYTPIYDVLAPTRWATPLGFKILYKWVSEKIPVMSEDYFLSLDDRLKLTADQFEKITELLEGGESSAKLGREMLWRMDYEDPETILNLFLWSKTEWVRDKVATEIGRTKREQLFLRKSNFAQLRNMTQGAFVAHMKNVITKENVLKLKTLPSEVFTIRTEFSKLGVSDCYDLKLVPKKGLEHLLNEV